GLLFDAAPRLALVLGVLTVLQAALPILNVWLTQLIVNYLAARQSAAHLLAPLLIYLAVLLTGAGLAPALSAAEALVSERLTGHVNQLLLARVNTFTDLSRFEDPALYNDLNTIGEHAPHLPRNLLRSATSVAHAVLSAAGLCLLLATLHPLVPFALLAVT